MKVPVCSRDSEGHSSSRAHIVSCLTMMRVLGVLRRGNDSLFCGGSVTAEYPVCDNYYVKSTHTQEARP